MTRDCTSWRDLPDGGTAACALIHGRPGAVHAGPDATGTIRTWIDEDPGVHRA